MLLAITRDTALNGGASSKLSLAMARDDPFVRSEQSRYRSGFSKPSSAYAPNKHSTQKQLPNNQPAWPAAAVERGRSPRQHEEEPAHGLIDAVPNHLDSLGDEGKQVVPAHILKSQ